jgi:hypothetical protein
MAFSLSEKTLSRTRGSFHLGDQIPEVVDVYRDSVHVGHEARLVAIPKHVEGSYSL